MSDTLLTTMLATDTTVSLHALAVRLGKYGSRPVVEHILAGNTN
jgi:hypothetical protein